MQIKYLPIALWMATAATAPLAMAADAVASAQPPIPQTPEAWLQRMTDFSQNGIAFKDPRAFMAWSNAVTEPGFYPVLVQGMSNPSMPLNMLNSAVNPAAVRNMASFADPAIAARWMGAAVDPRFYAQMATQFADPSKLMRWVMLPMDPRAIQAAGQMVNPAQAMQWATVPMDPRLWNVAGNMINPAAYAGMAGVAMNPQSYGLLQGAAVQPGVPIMVPVLPAGTLPQGHAKPAPSVEAVKAKPVVVSPVASSAVAPTPVSKAAVVAAPMTTPVVAAPVVAAPVAAALAKPVTATATVNAGSPSAAAQPAASVAAAVAPAMTAVVAPVVQALAAVASTPVVAANKDGMKTLSADMLFQPGKSDVKALTPAGKKALDAVVAQIKAASDVGQVVVMGHADPTGKAKGNQALSQQRAKAVKAYLTEKGVKPELIVTSGLGDTQPVVKCDPKAASADKIGCNAPNRRIEVEVRKLPPK